MKRILSLILCLMVVFQCFCVSAETGSTDTDITKEQYILNKLGVVELAGTEDMNREVTRAEFMSYINNILKGKPSSAETHFIDVPNSYWAAESIYALLERGIISYAADGRFNPDEIISYEQACKILVYTLGYQNYVDYEKGGMTEYVRLASRLNFDITPESASALTLIDAIDFIYKAMLVDTAYIVTNGEESTTSVSKGETLFSIYFDVYETEGRVKGYYGNTLSSKTADKDKAIIGDTEYKLNGEFSPIGLLGIYCDVVYTDINNVKNLLYAEAKNYDDVLVISSDSMVSFDGTTRTLSYTKGKNGDKVYKKVIPNTDEIVFNGKLLEGDLNEKVREFISGDKKGSISIIDNKSNQTVIIESFEVFVAGAYNSDKEILYGYYDNTKTYDLSTVQALIVKNDAGIETTIPVDYPSALLIAQSEDKEFINITICTTKEQIKVKQLSSDGKEITDDKDKKVAIDKSVASRTTFKLGGSYSVVYDIFGDIIYVSESVSDDYKIGYLRYISYLDDAFDGDWYIRLYDREGKDFFNYKLADKFVIDGTKYKKGDYKNWLLAIPDITALKDKDVTVKRQVIRYKLDADENIKEIDTYNCTSAEDSASTLTKMNGTDDSMYFIASPTSRFGMNVVVNASKTKYIVVPTVGDDGKVNVNGDVSDDNPELYSDTPSLKSWTYYDIEAYKCDSSTLIADIVVINQAPSVEAYDFIMFDEVTDGLDDDGDVVKVLNGISNGSRVSLTVNDACLSDALALKKGDIIQYSTNAAGDAVSAITKVFDYETRTFETNGSYNDRDRYWYYGNTSQFESQSVWQTSYHQIAKGYAYDLKDGVVSVAYTFGDAYKGDTKLIANLVSSIGVYDSKLKRNDMYIGSTSDIITYKNAGTDCDMILLCSRTTNVRQIFIYK